MPILKISKVPIKYNYYKDKYPYINIGPLYDAGFADGFESCKKALLKILDNPKNWEFIDNETESLTEKALNKLKDL